jgi:hypothetical protein
LLHSKIVDEKLPFDEIKVVAAHLSKNYPAVVSLLTDHQLFRMVATTLVSALPTAQQDVGDPLPSDLMYETGKPSDTCTLILSGKVTIIFGRDGFRSDVSSWSLLAAGALEDPGFAPDFTAFVSSGPCRCLRITRAAFAAAVDASALERTTKAKESVVVDTPSAGAESIVRKSKVMTALRAVTVGHGSVDSLPVSKTRSLLARSYSNEEPELTSTADSAMRTRTNSEPDLKQSRLENEKESDVHAADTPK